MVFYLFSALGIDMNIHFCAGKFDSILFASHENEGCKCSSGSEFKPLGIYKKVKSCCKDLHIHCALDSSHHSEEEYENKDVLSSGNISGNHSTHMIEKFGFNENQTKNETLHRGYRNSSRSRYSWPRTYIEIGVYRL